MPQPLLEPPVWHTSGGDNSRRGLFPTAVHLKSEPVRRLAARGSLQAPVVFDRSGTVFVADMTGHVQAFEPTGSRRWLVRLNGGIGAGPVAHPQQERLFVATFGGWVHALNSRDGREVWRQQIPTTSDPRILSDLLLLPAHNWVVCNSWGGRFRALEASTGREHHSWDAGLCPYAGASADSKEAVYCTRAIQGKGVQWLRVDPSGQETVLGEEPEKLRGARRSMVSAAPVVDEERGRVIFAINSDRGGFLRAWSTRTGNTLWSRSFDHGLNATPALTKDGRLLVAGLDGTVHALAEDGSTLWRYVTGCEYLLSSPVCDDAGQAFVGDPTGVVHQISREGLGQAIFEAPRALQARLAFDPAGHLYLPCTDRLVYVLG